MARLRVRNEQFSTAALRWPENRSTKRILAGVFHPLASPGKGKTAWGAFPFEPIRRTMTREEYQRDYRQHYKDHAKRVNLTLSLPEYRSLSRAAKSVGSPVAAYVKRLALEAHDGRQSTPDELAEQLVDLERVIRTIANNVNQMARHSHRIAHVLDEQEVFLHIAALQSELRTAITRAASGHGTAKTPDDEDGS